MKAPPKTRTGAQRYNSRMENIWKKARQLEAENIARGGHPNPNLTAAPVMRTQIEQDYGHAFTPEEWQAVEYLDGIAEKLANRCARIINKRALPFGVEPIRYNAQWTLEKLIDKLQAKV
jgi:hypothetical protein